MTLLTLGQLYYLARYSNDYRHRALDELFRRINHAI